MSADYECSVEQVRRAFGDKRYWLARLADSGADDFSLDVMDADADGAVRVMTTQTLRRDRLPGIVTQFIRGDLRIKRSETWSPVHDGSAKATIAASVPGAPVKVDGTATLAAAATGSTMAYAATVDVGIPLVGGKLENVVGSQLVDLLIAEQRFTSMWLTDNG